MHEVYERLAELAASESAIPGISTGLPDLDAVISGLNKSDLILLAARPGMGQDLPGPEHPCSTPANTRARPACSSPWR